MLVNANDKAVHVYSLIISGTEPHFTTLAVGHLTMFNNVGRQDGMSIVNSELLTNN